MHGHRNSQPVAKISRRPQDRSQRRRGRRGGRRAAEPAAKRARAAPSKPLHFIGWQYNPQIVAENVGIFKKLYDENVDYELVPGEYHAIAETKLIGGQHIDMMYSEEDQLVRWNTAGWIAIARRPAGHRRDQGRRCTRSTSTTCRCRTASLGGLPYYTGFNSFVCNEKHLDAAKLEPPATWEELLDQCRKLKKDKVAEYPYISAWGRQWASLSWSLFSIWYSRGRQGLRRQEQARCSTSTFRRSSRCTQTIYEEQLIPQDVLTQLGESVPSFATGQHTYMVVHEYDQKVFNTPADCRRSPAPASNAIMPGKTRSTFIWTALYLMGANPIDTDRAWNLMQFFGGKAKDGQYHVAKRWALEFGLGTPHKEVINEPGGPGRVQQVEGHGGRGQAAGDRHHRATSPRRSGSRSGTGT